MAGSREGAVVTDALQAGEDLAAKGATAPRVTLESMKARIVHEYCFTVGAAVQALGLPHMGGPLDILTICVLTLDNGWTLVGKSAPASAENFDVAKGQTFAFEDALRQLWPLEGYLLRDRLAAEEESDHGQEA